MVKKEKEPHVYEPQVGDKIYCEHKGQKYQAKILESKPTDDKKPTIKFLIHYQGWNKNWDEWVGKERIHEFNEANEALVKAQKVNARTKGGGGSARKKLAAGQQQTPTDTSQISATTSPQCSASESMIVEPEETIQLDKEVKIKIPNELIDWLIDDDNNIRNKKLTELPAKVTISTILKDFVNHKKTSVKALNDKEAMLNELTSGIKDYFNVMLGSFLLYKFERLQYQNLLREHKKDVDLTNYYGVIHLVRLFTKIGKPLASSTLDATSAQTIVNYIHDLLKFISKQSNLFDLERNYTAALPDYIKNALK